MEVYSWGSGAQGQLGHANFESSPIPRKISFFNEISVKAIACGLEHCLALSEDGFVFAWGRGGGGQLGLGPSLSNIATPKKIEQLANIDIIACGWHHSGAVTASGVLFTWGLGEYGRLGHGDDQKLTEPEIVDALSGIKIKRLELGALHSLAMTDGGQLWAWGGGFAGQLGLGDENDAYTPKVLNALEQKSIVSIAVGTHHSMALTDSCEVFSWGNGDFGKLGHGDEMFLNLPKLIDGLRGKGIIQVACGGFHSVALSDSNAVFVFGRGDKGQLGLKQKQTSLVPMLIESLEGEGITRVSCGMLHTVAMTVRGTLYSWGNGSHGELGLLQLRSSDVPESLEGLRDVRVMEVACGGFHTVALCRSVEDDQRKKKERVLEALMPFMAKKLVGGKELMENKEDEEFAGMTDEELERALAQSRAEGDEIRKEMKRMEERHQMELRKIEAKIQVHEKERDDIQLKVERERKLHPDDINLQALMKDTSKENVDLKNQIKSEQYSAKRHSWMVEALKLQTRQMQGFELVGLTAAQLEELERTLKEGVHRMQEGRASRLRKEFREKSDGFIKTVSTLRHQFESQTDTAHVEIAKMQEEKAKMIGLEQRLRQEFQAQVQAEQLTNADLKLRLETIQDGLVKMRRAVRELDEIAAADRIQQQVST